MKLKETAGTEVQQKLLLRLEQLFSKSGYRIVEVHHAVLRRAQWRIVLFHPNGICLGACEELHKIAAVEIERLSRNNDYSLELSSPGLGRRLRSYREFEIFCGQPVRCLLGDRWHSGALLGLAEAAGGTWELSLQAAGGILSFPLEQVLKVELDS